MNTKLILVLVISAILSSCSSESPTKQNNQTETTLPQVIPENNSTSIELNNGEKWKVDEKMMTHIHNMENDITAFNEMEQKDYKSLSGKLQTNLDLLRSGCTMEGKAHDELHKWLLPFMDLVKNLSETKNSETAATDFENIQASFTTFNHYFN